MTAPALERMALLRRQRQAADRSAHCHFLARLRIMQGYFGAAKFYQCEAARWHVRACELRLECTATPYVQQFGRAKRSITLREFSTGIDFAMQPDRTIVATVSYLTGTIDFRQLARKA